MNWHIPFFHYHYHYFIIAIIIPFLSLSPVHIPTSIYAVSDDNTLVNSVLMDIITLIKKLNQISHAECSIFTSYNKLNYSRLNMTKQTCIHLGLKACVQTILRWADKALEVAREQAKVLVASTMVLFPKSFNLMIIPSKFHPEKHHTIHFPTSSPTKS